MTSSEAAAWLAAIAAVFSGFFAWLSIRASNNARKLEQAWREEDKEREDRHRKEDREREDRLREETLSRDASRRREERIDGFIDAYTASRQRGIQACLDAGIASLEADDEIRAAVGTIHSRVGNHPFGGYKPLLDGLDTKMVLEEWMTSERHKRGADLRRFLNDKRAAIGLRRIDE